MSYAHLSLAGSRREMSMRSDDELLRARRAKCTAIMGLSYKWSFCRLLQVHFYAMSSVTNSPF